MTTTPAFVVTPSKAATRKFSDLELDQWLHQSCAQMGLKTATAVQAACIPPALQGKDVFGTAKTGCGKTAAFALPILQKLSEDPFGIYALVLTPTRELAFQIADQFRALGAPMSIRVSVVVGGMDMFKQATELQHKPHVVIATPGRLMDHLNSTTTCDLSRIKVLVLDEADRLLETSFAGELETIFKALPKRRQTLLFTASTSPNIEAIKSKDTFEWHETPTASTVDRLEQSYMFIPQTVKDCYLAFLLRKLDAKSAIVFTATCKVCELVSLQLLELGIKAVSLHSVKPQAQRLMSLQKFRSHQARVLVATDVASRGLDIPSVELVINYDLPRQPTDYLHRVGRTARAGRGGKAITLVTQHDVELVHAVEDLIGKQLTEHVESESEVLDLLSEAATAKRVAKMALIESEFGEQRKQRQQAAQPRDPSHSDAQAQAKQSKKKKEAPASSNGISPEATKTKKKARQS